MDKLHDGNVTPIEAARASVIPNEALAAIMAAMNTIGISFNEPMTTENCVRLLQGMGVDLIKMKRQNDALRAALKEAL